jgi:hypothetical protein
MAQTNLAPNAGNAALQNKKLKLFAAGILDSIPYIRMSRSYFKDDVKNKKAGMSYQFYVPDPGCAVAGTTDLNLNSTANAKKLAGATIWERPVTCTLVDGIAEVKLSAWNKLVSIEDFKRTVVDERARGLGAEIEQSVILNNVFRVDSAIVDSSGTPSSRQFALLTSKLRGIRSAGTKIAFAHPDVYACLGDQFLGKYLPSEIMKKIYDKLDVGNVFGAEWIEENYMPFVTATGSETVTEVDFDDADGIKITGTGLYVGMPIKIKGADGKFLKTVDLVGKPTNEDFVLIVSKLTTSNTVGYAQLEAGEVRFMNDKESSTVFNQSNPTIGYERYQTDGTDNLAKTGLSTTAGTVVLGITTAGTYAVVQIRDRDALEFDSYEFDEVAGAKNEKLKAMEITVQSVEQGDVTTRDSIMRIDVPYMAKLVLTKLARVLYMKIA